MDELKRQLSSQELAKFEASPLYLKAELTSRLCAEKICKLGQEYMTTPHIGHPLSRFLPAVFFQHDCTKITALYLITLGLLCFLMTILYGEESPMFLAAYRLAFVFPLFHLAWHANDPSLKWAGFMMSVLLAQEALRTMLLIQRRDEARRALAVQE